MLKLFSLITAFALHAKAAAVPVPDPSTAVPVPDPSAAVIVPDPSAAVPVPNPSASRLLSQSGSSCFDDDATLIAEAQARNIAISGCAEAADLGGCGHRVYGDTVTSLCECACPHTLTFGDHAKQTLDVYLTSEMVSGIVLFVHGGGWRSGAKGDVPDWLLALRAQGYHVASTDYRLTTTHAHPAQIEDVEDAVRLLKAKAATLNTDPQKIVIVGSSAGGHLVSLLGTRNGPSSDARVAGVVDIFGPTVLFTGDDEGDCDERIDELLNCTTCAAPNTACNDAAVAASPITHVAEDGPPFLIFQGTEDPTVPLVSSAVFQAQLESAGIDSTLVVVPGVGHDKNCIMLGETDGRSNLDHLSRWINQTVTTGSSGGIVGGGGTVNGTDVGGPYGQCDDVNDA